MNDEMKNKAKRLFTILRRIGADFQLGGSRYFGYARETSDLDVLVHRSDIESLEILLECLGYKKKFDGVGYLLQNGRLYALDSLIHVIVVRDAGDFNRIRREYQTTRAYLELFPDELERVKSLQLEGKNGSYIYNELHNRACIFFNNL